MKFKDLNSTVIKNRLKAQSVHRRWHNKNKSGGNFGINIIGYRNYEISGTYNKEGEIIELRFGFCYHAGILINVNSLEEMFEVIEKIINSMRKS